jgi:hypothetical protein
MIADDVRARAFARNVRHRLLQVTTPTTPSTASNFLTPTGLVAALPLGPTLFCRLLPQHHTQEPRFGVE